MEGFFKFFYLHFTGLFDLKQNNTFDVHNIAKYVITWQNLFYMTFVQYTRLVEVFVETNFLRMTSLFWLIMSLCSNIHIHYMYIWAQQKDYPCSTWKLVLHFLLIVYIFCLSHILSIHLCNKILYQALSYNGSWGSTEHVIQVQYDWTYNNIIWTF